jgi:alanine dehydrogenase
MTQLAAIAAVRRLKRVRVFSPNPEHRAEFAVRAGNELDLRVEPAESAAAAVMDAPIVTVVTRARAPVITAAMIATGAHVNAVGAISPERAEFAADLLPRCGLIIADSVQQVRNLSRELIDTFGEDETQWARLKPLSQIVAARDARPRNADVTLFKAMGMGISDLSLGMEIYRRAVARSVGHKLAPTVRARPRLRSDAMTSTGG